MAGKYDLCPGCQEPLDDIEAEVRLVIFGSVVNGKLTAEVTDEEMASCRCGKCYYDITRQVKEWDYISKGKEVRLGL